MNSDILLHAPLSHSFRESNEAVCVVARSVLAGNAGAGRCGKGCERCGQRRGGKGGTADAAKGVSSVGSEGWEGSEAFVSDCWCGDGCGRCGQWQGADLRRSDPHPVSHFHTPHTSHTFQARRTTPCSCTPTSPLHGGRLAGCRSCLGLTLQR